MTIHHNKLEDRGVFYIKGENGVISELTYKRTDDDTITIDHTETKVAEEGKGLATKLVAHTVAFARENGYKINPLCPFAEVQFDQNPSYNDLRV